MANFRISEQDYVDASVLHLRPTARIRAVLLVGIVSLILVIAIGDSTWRAGAIGGLIGGGLFAVLIRYLIAPLFAKQHYKQYKAIHDEFSISLKEEGVFIESSTGQSLLPWGMILTWRENKDFLLLYPVPNLYHVIPKAVAEQGVDIDVLTQHLRQQVGEPI